MAAGSARERDTPFHAFATNFRAGQRFGNSLSSVSGCVDVPAKRSPATESSAAGMNACSLTIKFSLIIVLSTPPVCLRLYFERSRAAARPPAENNERRSGNAHEAPAKASPPPRRHKLHASAAEVFRPVCQRFLSDFLMPNLMPSPFRNTRHTNKVARFISSIPCIPTALCARSSIF